MISLYEADNPIHIKSFLVTAKVFDMVLMDHYPNTTIRFPRTARMEMVYVFLCLQGENQSIHPEILKRNVYVAAKKRYRHTIHEEDFMICLNMFLILYITNCCNIDADIQHIALDAEVLTFEGLINISQNLGATMMEVINVGYNRNYQTSMLGTKLIDFNKAYDHVVNQRQTLSP